MSVTPLEIAASAVQARQHIRQHIYQTPLIPAKKTGIKHGARVFFKAENFQLTVSFKLRGAMSKMSNHTGNKPLITASSGNHGIGSAQAASVLHKSLTVVLPEQPSLPNERRLSRLASRSSSTAQKRDRRSSMHRSSPRPASPPGQATIGLEILEQCDHVDNAFVSMGGRWAHQWYRTYHLPTLAEGVAGGIDEDSTTFPLASAVVDQVIECNQVEIAAALRSIAHDETMIVEGSDGLALAGFDKVAHQLGAETSIVLLCGANIDGNTIKEVLYGS
ncbi:threonine dehydratase catabolic [Verticillium dahliae VdLs.17]|uniref:Threonine dehydratase catabolic n=1 Tax=Verticillium dahliae (strain VdLs.17 / ATCC MYA-4575 / FGSC 10137) TaxID=498257 RepID=G2X0B7_VERDV|nr:threonine dehydratase catabolic [Verticillium dahliae VdLs.17]EGY22258.1 threonine dehydratase catabolic [Verticillium dahliae VdLs.17]